MNKLTLHKSTHLKKRPGELVAKARSSRLDSDVLRRLIVVAALLQDRDGRKLIDRTARSRRGRKVLGRLDKRLASKLT